MVLVIFRLVTNCNIRERAEEVPCLFPSTRQVLTWVCRLLVLSSYMFAINLLAQLFTFCLEHGRDCHQFHIPCYIEHSFHFIPHLCTLSCYSSQLYITKQQHCNIHTITSIIVRSKQLHFLEQCLAYPKRNHRNMTTRFQRSFTEKFRRRKFVTFT